LNFKNVNTIFQARKEEGRGRKSRADRKKGGLRCVRKTTKLMKESINGEIPCS
jgi:hypothetical protein